MAKDQGMTVLAWSPLHDGLLTGKYLPENQGAEAFRGRREQPGIRAVLTAALDFPAQQQMVTSNGAS